MMISARRISLMAVAVLAASAAAYSAYWWWGAGKMDETVSGWINDWRRAGYRIDYSEKTVGGFPWTVRIRLVQPALADPAGAWSWSGGNLDLSAEPWAPTTYKLSAEGNHEAVMPIAGRLVPMQATAGKAEGTAEFDLDGRLRQADITLENVDGTAPALNADLKIDRATMTLTQPARPAREHQDEEAAIDLLVQGLRLPAALSGPLGRDVTHTSLRARLLGPFPRTDMRGALEIWRDAGGTLDVPWLSMEWGPTKLRAEGTMALDDLLRPSAAFEAKVAGLSGTLDALVAANLIKPDAARLAGVGLMLFARTPPGGGEPELAVPLSALDGQVYLGPIKMGRVPPVLPPEKAAVAPPPAPVTAESLPAPGSTD
ncbi:DUF2125 domain-containing protein [Hwanghaeella grinnelliae]|uniref:DUF2125 domain-containing protein n=1 Tax=Hwanghaeella grinnelliae TaxID=2500179 RepID=A0A437QQ83_9PROT|nr:DUF2125 domain-containing protein [Hwanghaeella grinnelliae]RVU36609.1 DUF2125 domain-containing protein [Hwanghaeella grinnelliae]